MAREILKTNNPDYRVELDTGGWEDRYRLLHGDAVTAWGGYDDALMLGELVAVSPYYHDKDTWQMMSLVGAAGLLFVGVCTVKEPEPELPFPVSDQ